MGHLDPDATVSAVSGEQVEQLLRREMGTRTGFDFSVEPIAAGSVRLRLHFHRNHLRPGRTIAGPVLFTLADTALYPAVLSVVGMVPFAVTADMSIHFLRKPTPADLVASAELVKSDGRLVCGTVEIRSVADGRVVAHSSGTYAVPRGQARKGVAAGGSAAGAGEAAAGEVVR